MTTALRVCLEPGCPAYATHKGRGRCPDHAREWERKRGSSSSRGYGQSHKELRKQWTPFVMKGLVHCARCQLLIRPDQMWDLGHDDFDRTLYTGPEHAKCNRQAPRINNSDLK